MSEEKKPKSFADEARLRVKLGLLFGLPGLAFGIYKSSWLLSLIGVVFILEALLMHRRSKAGIHLSFLFFIVVLGYNSWLIATDGLNTMRGILVGVSLFSLWGEWLNFGPILRGRASWDDPIEPPEDEDEESPLISIVLLQRKPRTLDEPILTEILKEAWGPGFSAESEEEFVVGEDPMHIIKSRDGFWVLHNNPEPYANPEEMAEDIPELRLRNAVLEHGAWMAVDLMRPANEDLPLDSFYPYIFRLIRELADDDTLVIYRPETGQVNVWDEEVAQSLGTDDPLGSFNEPSNVPVVPREVTWARSNDAFRLGIAPCP